MELNSQSLFAKYYRWMFHGKMAQDSCTLIRNTFFSVLLLPFIWINFILPWSGDIWDDLSLFKRFMWSILVYVTTVIISGYGNMIVVDGLAYNLSEHTLWSRFWIGLIVMFCVAVCVVFIIAVLVVIVSVIVHFVEKRKEKKSLEPTEDSLPKEPTNIQLLYRSLKDKYCIKIIWK